MGEPAAEFNDSDSDSGLSSSEQLIEYHEFIGLDLNPDSYDQSTTEWVSDPDNDNQSTGESMGMDSRSDHDAPAPLTERDWDPDNDEDQPEHADQLSVPHRGGDLDSEEDDEYQPHSPSEQEYQLPIPPTGWDWNPNDDHQPQQSLCFYRVCRCLSFSAYKNPQLERGDKIIMPPSYLREILSLGLEFPLFFKIENASSKLSSHCGVLEFDSIEGFIFMPEWMMNNLKAEDGGYLIIRSAVLSPGNYMKLQPHATAFTQISKPKAVLEKVLRDFTCLSRGDTFMIRYNGRNFHFDVLEVAPTDAISLIETDCEVEFAQPLDYKEPEPEPEPVEAEGLEEDVKEFRPFMGTARRLDGNPVIVRSAVPEEGKTSTKDDKKEVGKEKFKPFTGRSYTLG